MSGPSKSWPGQEVGSLGRKKGMVGKPSGKQELSRTNLRDDLHPRAGKEPLIPNSFLPSPLLDLLTDKSNITGVQQEEEGVRRKEAGEGSPATHAHSSWELCGKDLRSQPSFIQHGGSTRSALGAGCTVGTK